TIFAAILHPLGNAERAVVAGPRCSVTSKTILLVLGFFAVTLAGHPPARNLFYVRRVGHVDDHDRIAIGPLLIFQPQLIVPAAVEIGVLATVVKVVMRAVALFAGVELFEQNGL